MRACANPNLQKYNESNKQRTVERILSAIESTQESVPTRFWINGGWLKIDDTGNLSYSKKGSHIKKS